MNNAFFSIEHSIVTQDYYDSIVPPPENNRPNFFCAGKNGFAQYSLFPEDLVAATGLSSQRDVLGRTDHEMGWGAVAAGSHPYEWEIIGGKPFSRLLLEIKDPDGRHRKKLHQYVPVPTGRGLIGVYTEMTDIPAEAMRSLIEDYSERRLLLNSGETLSWREYNVMEQLSYGHGRAHICRTLGISLAAFDTYRKRLNAKFDCSSKWLPYRATQEGALILGLFDACWTPAR